MSRPYAAAVGKFYLDGCGGSGQVGAWAVGEDVVSGGTGIGYGSVVEGLSTGKGIVNW